ncbi:glycosyltransferase [Winogradskyella aurantiaca]|uniref:glycosyltransferase n=1 Tax=Winogradskyella aurantiaca TaxID=2219558 RepID=UPI000E1CDA7E|nr:glycosyltransferase [Winogradskyella aurantiaca]
MKVLQLVDSLEAGGTERMAVNLANGLVSHVQFSGLCATRVEGPLKQQLKSQVSYLFLGKSSRFDILAWKRLYKFIKKNNIDILHAHSSSYGLAVVMKWLHPTLKIVWHDHYGQSEFLDQRPKRILKLLSRYFSGSITVNAKLESWHRNILSISRVIYLPNFISTTQRKIEKTTLKGIKGKRIICLANWRPQKDLINLLDAFEQVVKQCPDWSLHLVGKHFNDNYEEEVLSKIESMEAREAVNTYGSVSDVPNVLLQSSIGVLSSSSEGLPLSLLEYGQTGLPVVATNVGDCNRVIINNKTGLLVESENSNSLFLALNNLIRDKIFANKLGKGLNELINDDFSENGSIHKLLGFYTEL